MSKKDKEQQIEHYKVFLKKLVLPNMKEWFKFQTTTYTHSNYREKLDPQDVQYVYFDYTTTSTSYQGQQQVHKNRVYVIETELPVRTYYYLGRHLSGLDKFNGGSVQIISSRNIQSIDAWNIEGVETVIREAEKHPQFKTLQESLDIDAILGKEKAKRSKQREAAEKKRAVKFTFTDQKAIGKVLLNLIIDKTGNYLLKLMDERIGAQDADVTGEALVKAMEIYSLDKNDIINALMNSPNVTARRFAALFAENNVAALIDQDKAVRLAAKARQVKKKEEQTDATGDMGMDQ